MPTKEVKSEKKCKDCGSMAYSYQVGWTDSEGETHWHPIKNYNQCKDCRKKLYKRIERKKRKNNSHYHGSGKLGGKYGA